MSDGGGPTAFVVFREGKGQARVEQIDIPPGRSFTRPHSNALPWMAVAACAAAALAIGALTHFGAGKPGLETALRLTARLAFLFFWPSYAGGALVALFGPTFRPVKRRARAAGLAFAAVLAVHLGLVGALCWIGSAPAAETFAIFGLAAAWTGLLALASIERFGRALGASGWWVLRNIGMNYVAFAFALDFLGPRHQTPVRYLAEYAPFALLAVLGPALRVLAWLKPILGRGRGRQPPSAHGWLPRP